MENASKALIIAASILIAVLLIALGMRIFNSTKGIEDQTKGTMEVIEIGTFNSRFTSYAGTGKSKAEVISLLSAIISNNAVNPKYQVKVLNLSGGERDIVSFMNTGLTEDTYTIQIQTPVNGYITAIKIY